MDAAQHTKIVEFIWSIADEILRDVYKRHKYRDVILPMTVIRRLDAVLEPTKQEVLKTAETLQVAGVLYVEGPLRAASGQAFYNVSPFRLRDLLSTPKQIAPNFRAYLSSFSPNVTDILARFQFDTQVDKLAENDLLGQVIQKFTDHKINLSPYHIGTIPGLDNHGMGSVFEELIRRFNEADNEEAGEHFTPRDVVALMARLVFEPVADKIADATYTIYDGACGTGGMLSVAEDALQEIGRERGKRINSLLYGQEVNDESYAICKADMILKGEGENADNIFYGSTLSADHLSTRTFDFMLSNPPYGKDWKSDLARMGVANNKKQVRDPRFITNWAGNPEYTLLTTVADGQMLFLVNKLHKMKQGTTLGSRIAEVHNGSALFTGDAGSGESNIRRWILENDWLEAIVALPTNIFYNTAIATYIWLLSNRKHEKRKGKVQLIDATGWHRPLRKNLGKRNQEMSTLDIDRVVKTYDAFEQSDQSKIFPNKAFGYRKVTVERPLRLRVDFTPEKIAALRETGNDDEIADAAARFVDTFGDGYGGYDNFRSDKDGRPVDKPGTYYRYNEVIDALPEVLGKKLTTKRIKTLREAFCVRDERADPVSESVKVLDDFGKALFLAEMPIDVRLSGKVWTIDAFPILEPGVLISWHPRALEVEYEPDPELRDTEQIPLLEEGGILGFMEREVWPHVPDAWVDLKSEKTGYEISFTRYFFKPMPMRTLDEIRTDILSIETEAEGLLNEIFEITGVGASIDS